MTIREATRYTVIASFDDPGVAAEWVAWLRDEHLADVLAAGALDAEVVALEGAAAVPVELEVRYRFADRASLEQYFADHAPRLRAEGLAKFPPERGIRYRRSVGEAVVTQTR
ncbi:MAG: DUF4286 family protein [Phycisphaerales bacterium]